MGALCSETPSAQKLGRGYDKMRRCSVKLCAFRSKGTFEIMRSGGQSVQKYFSRYSWSRTCLHPKQNFNVRPCEPSDTRRTPWVKIPRNYF